MSSGAGQERPPVPGLAKRSAVCATRLMDAEAILVASHVDADGLTSAGIASTALARAQITHEVCFADQLDDTEIAQIAATEYDTVLFTDFGSGQLDIISEHETAGDFTPVIADHHQPASANTEFHLNPLLEGIDGAAELSGAGATYVLARALPDGAQNRDLAALAVVGAVGDRQLVGGELVGANAAIAQEGVEVGVLEMKTDLAMYGTQTRPLPKLLEYASDVRVPGITGNQTGAIRFLDDLDVDAKEGDEWRSWVDLDDTERQAIVSGLLRKAVSRGIPSDKAEDLVGTSYTLTREKEGTELRDASEFSTLLNATARYERADVGLAVCLGDRDGALSEARRLLRTHRRNLSEGLDWIIERGVTRENHLQWIHAKDQIRDTIVGIVAGMAVGTEGIDRETPIIAFAQKTDEPESIKVSARGTPGLVDAGLDLSQVMRDAAASVGGDGGGHDIAAGATIPSGQEVAFIAEADRIIGKQIA
jgi:single-stranded-DNA-specific exonuclease